MKDELSCGSIRERVRSCNGYNTKQTCQPNDRDLWTSDSHGYTYLCEWNDLMKKCVNGPSCLCSAAPFQLDSVGIHDNVPTECEHLTAEQCSYFRTSDNKRCVTTLNGKCMSPNSTEPVCTGIDFQYLDAAYDDSCPFGTNRECKDICLDRDSGGNPIYTGPATEILSYPCFGFYSHGHGKYCKCSFHN